MSNAYRRVILSCLLLYGIPPSSSQPVRPQVGLAPEFKVGGAFRKFTPSDKSYDWRGAKTHALLATVWYPAIPSAVTEPVEIPGMSELFVVGSCAPDATIASSPAKFPMIVLSHGTGGSALQMAWLGTVLAAHGYIAVAVNHPGNNATEDYTAQGFLTWWERARDLSVAIDSMLADPMFGAHIDASRIGAAGFSLGGYAMIEIAGGITDPAALKEFCASPRADAGCKSPPEFRRWSKTLTRCRRPTRSFKPLFATRAIPIVIRAFERSSPWHQDSGPHSALPACRKSRSR